MYVNNKMNDNYINLINKEIIDINLSKRLPDHFEKYKMDILDKGINICDKWDNFLDVGANNGRYSYLLLEKGFKSGVAVEVSENKSLKELGEKYSNLNITNKLIQDFITEEKFDFILLSDVFEHIPLSDLNEFLQKLSDLQNDNGVIYILTPNSIVCGPAEKSDIYYTKHQHGHHKHYTKKEIELLLKQYNYNLIFHTYEENKLKASLRNIFLRFSAKDKVLMKSKIYSLLSLPLIFILNMLFKSVAYFVYINEKKNHNCALDSVSQILVFKK